MNFVIFVVRKMHTQKNGKKIRKKIRGAVASDWMDYYGSSDQLTRDIESLGRDRFRREILYYCKSKARRGLGSVLAYLHLYARVRSHWSMRV